MIAGIYRDKIGTLRASVHARINETILPGRNSLLFSFSRKHSYIYCIYLTGGTQVQLALWKFWQVGQFFDKNAIDFGKEAIGYSPIVKVMPGFQLVYLDVEPRNNTRSLIYRVLQTAEEGPQHD